MSPNADKRFRIFCETNGYMGEVSAEAAGIIATLFALSHLSFRHEVDQLSEAYMRLYGFAGDHPEAGEIFKAIGTDAGAAQVDGQFLTHWQFSGGFVGGRFAFCRA